MAACSFILNFGCVQLLLCSGSLAAYVSVSVIMSWCIMIWQLWNVCMMCMYDDDVCITIMAYYHDDYDGFVGCLWYIIGMTMTCYCDYYDYITFWCTFGVTRWRYVGRYSRAQCFNLRSSLATKRRKRTERTLYTRKPVTTKDSWFHWLAPKRMLGHATHLGCSGTPLLLFHTFRLIVHPCERFAHTTHTHTHAHTHGNDNNTDDNATLHKRIQCCIICTHHGMISHRKHNAALSNTIQCVVHFVYNTALDATENSRRYDR